MEATKAHSQAPVPPIQPDDPSATKTSRTTPVFAPGEDWELLAQGAEARLWKIPPGQPSAGVSNHKDSTRMMIAKERFRKAYRHPVLDDRLTLQRCRREGRLLDKCHKAGIAVPKVWRVTAPVLYMEYLPGPTVRTWLQQQQNDTTTAARLGHIMGTAIGSLHALGVVHGDLTTSNMILMPSSAAAALPTSAPSLPLDDNPVVGDLPTTTLLYLIDFGLAKNSSSNEDRAVDLYVLERAIASTHVPRHLPATFMDQVVLPAYRTGLGGAADKVMQRLEQVRQRGRKRECFG